MDILSGEELRQLSYVELKKYAKRQGIKKTNKKFKAEKLIEAILSASQKTDGALESLSCNENIDNSLNQSQLSHEVTDNGDMSSRRKSKRLTRVFPLENTSQQNKSSSDDSEVQIMTPQSSLRRTGTFCVETPVIHLPKSEEEAVEVSPVTTQSVKQRATASVSDVPIKNLIPDAKKMVTISDDKTYIVSTCHPTLTPAKTPRKSILRHDVKRYSGRKSNVSTPSSGELKSNGNKVNFITPDRTALIRSSATSATLLRSVKDRPKTPIASKVTPKRKRSCSPFPERSQKMMKTTNGLATPATPRLLRGKKLDKALQTDTPLAKSVERKPFAVAAKMHREKLATHPASVKKNGSEKKKVQTPNFKEIHQKAFDKMEALDEYHERKKNRIHGLTRSQKKSATGPSPAQHSVTKRSVQNNKNSPEQSSQQKAGPKTRSQIPLPMKGIPFIPVVKSIRNIKTNFAAQTQSHSKVYSSSKTTANNRENSSKKCQRILFTPGPINKVFTFGKDTENLSIVTDENKFKTRKFDLKASLAKKLPYKPYRGVLRPLADSDYNISQVNSHVDPIKRKREQSREILKGVRKNKRFELQMSRRGLS